MSQPFEDIRGFVHRVRRAILRSIVHPIAKNTLRLVGSQYIAAVIRLVTTVCAARMLTSVEFGTAALVMAYPTLMLSIFGMKSQIVTIKYLSVFRAQKHRDQLRGLCKLAYAIDLFPTVLVALLVIYTAEWVSIHFYDLAGLSWLMVVYAASAPLISLGGTSQAILSSHQEFPTLAFFVLLQPTVSLLCVVAFLGLGFGVAGMVLGLTIGRVVNSLGMNVVAVRVLYRDGSGFWWQGKIASVRSLQQEFYGAIGWNYVLGAVSGLLDAAPLMLLGRYRPVEEVGFYRLAESMVSVARFLESSMGRVVYPVLSARLQSGAPGAVAGTLRKYTLRGGWPMALVPLLAALVIPSAVPLLFGSNYAPMITGAQLLMVGASFNVLFFWIMPAYLANNQFGVYTKCFIAYASVMLTAFWFAVEGWGFLGLAAVQALGRGVFLSIMAVPRLR